MKLTIRNLILSTLVAMLVATGVASAQEQQQKAPLNPRREMLEQRLRERTGEVVKQRLQLNDDQMRKLQASNKQFEVQRTGLLTRERDLRRELRQQIMAGDKANQNRVAELLDQTFVLERQRLDLVQSEQRELAKFLTPVQRAKLFGLQNELRRRTQELKNRQMQRRQGGAVRPPGRFNQ
jgi:periplasmic protein CpxP/Spy